MAENPPTAPERQALLKQQWLEFQRRRGLKTTAQRELIVDVFLRCSDHVSIEELLTEVRSHSAKVGYATVYRTMKLLADAGLAALRQFGDGQTRYEVAGSEAPHHDHLICMKCGLILEFENHEIEELQESVAEKLGGFKIMTHKLELYGLCPKAMGVPSGSCPDETANPPGKHSRPLYPRMDGLREKP
jgi:Fur family ferric uptake transcriptional regulator